MLSLLNAVPYNTHLVLCTVMGGTTSILESPIFESVRHQFDQLSKNGVMNLDDLSEFVVPKGVGSVDLVQLPILFKVWVQRYHMRTLCP